MLQDIKYRRVSAIQEPWYDDHFDVPSEHQRLGRTLCMLIGWEEREAGQGDLLTRGYRLIGCGFYRKFDEGLRLMQEWAESADLKEAVDESQVPIALIDSFVSEILW